MVARSQIGRAAILLIALVGMAAPSGAGAAKVVNGDFESGTLSGWQVHRATGAGSWFARGGTNAPIGSKRPDPADPVQPPPQGAFAAIADQANPDTLILYQDVVLEPGFSHRLSLLAYYDAYSPIAVPNPDTLSVDDEALRLPSGKFQKNQQFRIDVMEPEAPLESLEPAAILRTVFATKPGAPLHMAPTRLSADLSAFAGRTVRLRIAAVAREEVLNAGVDAVSISTPGLGQGGSRGRGEPLLFSLGGVAANRRRGTATLRARVFGAGLLRAKGVASGGGRVDASRPRGPRKLIEPVTLPVTAARAVTFHLRLTPAARAQLSRRHRLRVPIAVTFLPFGGAPETTVTSVVFRLAHLSK